MNFYPILAKCFCMLCPETSNCDIKLLDLMASLQCSFHVIFSSAITANYLQINILSIRLPFAFNSKKSVLTFLFVIDIYLVSQTFS